VRGRLAEDIPLGYSAAGVVIEVGTAVAGIRPGQLVATGGAGKASHAQVQAVPGLLCAVIPDGVPPQDAAFTTVASVALHGLRLAEAGPSSKVVVSGLGLVGQLATAGHGGGLRCGRHRPVAAGPGGGGRVGGAGAG
jgi:threonine dehydrogenase-like Zn-dependent dehydrogenase